MTDPALDALLDIAVLQPALGERLLHLQESSAHARHILPRQTPVARKQPEAEEARSVDHAVDH